MATPTNSAAGSLFATRINNRPKPSARLVEVVGYDHDETIEGCYKGTIKGKLLDGPKAGQEITVALTKTAHNLKTPKVDDLTAVKALPYTPVGGVLHFDNLVEAGKHHTATWVNKFAPSLDLDLIRPGILTRVMPWTQYSAGSRSYEVRRHKTNNAVKYKAEFLHMEHAEATSSLEEARAALTKAFEGVPGSIGQESNRAVFAVGVLKAEDGTVSRTERVIWRGFDKENNRNFDVETAVENAIQNLGEEKLAAIFEMGGKLDIVPMSALETGAKTSEMVDKALETKGRGIVDVARFRLGEEGSGYGFAPSNVLIQHFEDRRSGDKLEGVFMAKGYTQGRALPQWAINTPSDPDASKRFWEPINAAAREKRAAQEGAENKVETPAQQEKAPAAEAKADKAPAAETKSEAKPEVKTEAKSEAKGADLLAAQPDGVDQPDVIEGLDDILDDISIDELQPA